MEKLQRNLATSYTSLRATIRLPRRSKPTPPKPPSPSDTPTKPLSAPDLLPSLPSPRQPITPTPPSPQPQSPFFRLPPELRVQIYRLLLSDRTIHLDMRYSAIETSTPHSTAGAQFFEERRWCWRVSICHRHPDKPVSEDSCGWGEAACGEFETGCGVGREVLGLLRACRITYREFGKVVYGENVFHVSTGAVVLFTERLLSVGGRGMIKSLILNVREETVLDYAREHLGIEPGWGAYRALVERVPVAFPGVRRVEIVVSSPRLVREMVDREVERLRVAYPFNDIVQASDVLYLPVHLLVEAWGKQLEECVLVLGDKVCEVVPAPTGAGRIEVVAGRYTQYWMRVGTEGCGFWVRRMEAAGPLDALAEL